MWQKIKNIYHLVIAIMANFYFQFPGKKITVIGVTGTDGKTTTALMVNHILKISNKKTANLTSLGADIGGKEVVDTGFHVTTPSPFALQRLIKKAVDLNSEYFVLEITSHAIDQFRVWGIPVKISILTNISNEHLDYHKTYENYANTKFKLLESSEIAILNKKDRSYDYFEKKKKLGKVKKLITYSLEKGSDFTESTFDLESKEIIGKFNKLNALSAAVCCLELGINKTHINKAINSFKMPIGRFDFVYNKNYSVLIDFAHTPKAFGEVLSTIRPDIKGKIIHVFGSAGERDSEKRPLLGKVSSKYSDIVILTAEDPRSEELSKIIDEIGVGVNKKTELLKIDDRISAIKTAIDMAEPGDLVLITGKSHEKSMVYRDEEVAWDEYAVVRKAIKEKK